MNQKLTFHQNYAAIFLKTLEFYKIPYAEFSFNEDMVVFNYNPDNPKVITLEPTHKMIGVPLLATDNESQDDIKNRFKNLIQKYHLSIDTDQDFVQYINLFEHKNS